MMDEHIKSIDRKFYRSFYKITKEKQFLNKYKNLLLNDFIETVESYYIASKIRELRFSNYSSEDKLRELYRIYNFKDKKLFIKILNVRFRNLSNIISLIKSEIEFNSIWNDKNYPKRKKVFLFENSADRLKFIRDIEKVKKAAGNKYKIITKRRVANKMGLTEATFRDKLFHYKINFNDPK